MVLKIISSIRTNNFDDPHMFSKIEEAWNESRNELVKSNSPIYVIYHQYESDYRGDFTLSICIEDQAGSIDLSPYDKYKAYPVNLEDKEGIGKAWAKVWKDEEDKIIERTYLYDYEKYDINGLIEIFVGIK